MKTTPILAGLSALALSAAAFAQPVAAPTTPISTAPMPAAAPAILIKHGHVYTVGAAGTLADGDVLIQSGKIVQVGANIAAPAGATGLLTAETATSIATASPIPSLFITSPVSLSASSGDPFVQPLSPTDPALEPHRVRRPASSAPR